MTFAIKAEISDPQAKTFSFKAQKTMYGGKHIAKGDTIFVFASENEGGQGLIARGVATSVEAVAKKRGMPKRLMQVCVVVCVGAVVGVTAGQRRTMASENDTIALVAANESGMVRTVNLNGALDLNNPFFKELGTNGRNCFSCHRPAQGWSITPESVRRRFEE